MQDIITIFRPEELYARTMMAMWILKRIGYKSDIRRVSDIWKHSEIKNNIMKIWNSDVVFLLLYTYE